MKKQNLIMIFLFLLWYNSFMEYITVVIDSFWLIMEQIATIFTPILAIHINPLEQI